MPYPREREIEILAEAQRELRRELKALKVDYTSADTDDIIRALRKSLRGRNGQVICIFLSGCFCQRHTDAERKEQETYIYRRRTGLRSPCWLSDRALVESEIESGRPKYTYKGHVAHGYMVGHPAYVHVCVIFEVRSGLPSIRAYQSTDQAARRTHADTMYRASSGGSGCL